MRFDGQVAVVTGGASGIGRAVAQTLASEGAQVHIWDRSCTKNPVDITSTAAIEAALAPIPHVDILVHSAGIQTYGTATTTTDEIWDRTMLVNVTSAFLVCRAMLPKMKHGAAISLVGSVQSVGAVANSAAYVTSKHALLGLARSIALDYAALGIRCNCVCPGAIDTPMLRHSAELTGDPAGTLAACADVHILGRLGQAEEVARAIAFLSSSDASFITGTAFQVDGGAMVPVGGAAFQRNGTARAKS